MKYWKVIVGKIDSNFSTIVKAKQFARKFEFAQIIDNFGFVRFISKNYRIFKI